jgi:type I restriction enzyme R subunit
MALIRRACGIDGKLTPFSETVRRNFQTWIMRRHAGVPTGEKFTDTQTAFLQLIRDHVMTSFRFECDDLDYAPFDAQGGLGKMHQLFGDQMDVLIDELNGELVA